MSLEHVREIADAVLYEGYLLYPYRASSSKNQSRWQFGVLGPPNATAASFSEDPAMSMQCLVRPRTPIATVTVHLRFLQLQAREAQLLQETGRYVPVPALDINGERVLSWDEAVEREITLPDVALGDALDFSVDVPAGEDVESVTDASGAPVGRIVRRRWQLSARVQVSNHVDDGFHRLSVQVENTHPAAAADKDSAIRTSLIGAHLLLESHDAAFVSLLEPVDEARQAAEGCRQRRCFPVLAGAPGATDVVLGAPIILYDYPEIAAQSPGALFDSTEIDEILTLRVMTMTEQEKDEARATDPRARAIIKRCDGMSASDMQQLHGILRTPRIADLRDLGPSSFDSGDVPWWDPAADASVQPEVDAVRINEVSVSRGSIVRVHPSRRADAQDLFFADQLARVTAVLSDVDGDVHVAVVLLDDPAADMHEWYGRYFYFAPDELEPVSAGMDTTAHREEIRS